MSRLGRLMAVASVLALAGCGAASLAPTLWLAMAVASALVLASAGCDDDCAHEERACVNGRWEDKCCPVGASCNYGLGVTDCGDGLCAPAGQQCLNGGPAGHGGNGGGGEGGEVAGTGGSAGAWDAAVDDGGALMCEDAGTVVAPDASSCVWH